MTAIFAITNQKGGVGKTTTSINLAASLAATKRRVLMIDLDPQGNATTGSGIDKNSLHASSSDVLLERASVDDALVETRPGGYWLLPGDGSLTVAEVELVQAGAREYRLKQALKAVAGRFDFILIDCPPTLNTLTVNSLVAANGVIIPMQCEYYALEGLSALLKTIERIRQTANAGLEVTGLLRTMYDPRNNLANDVSDKLTTHFGQQVFRTIIPRNVTLAEAPSHGVPVLHYDKSCRGSLAYLALAGEILRKGTAPVSEPPQPLLENVWENAE